jgi:predicted HTH transcriptional regulator
LADQKKIFRSILGTVEFEPRENEVKGKKVRNITVAQFGTKQQAIKIGATLWPSHAHIEVSKGDIVAMRGAFTQNTQTKEDGSSITYNNLSVTAFKVLGQLDEGVKPETENTPAEDAGDEDDDIPF